MSHTDADAFGDAAAAEGSGDEGLAAVIEVDLIPCLVLLGVVKGDIAGLFQHGYGSGNSLALGLGGIQEGLVAFAEILGGLQGVRGSVGYRFIFIEQIFQFLGGFHFENPF